MNWKQLVRSAFRNPAFHVELVDEIVDGFLIRILTQCMHATVRIAMLELSYDHRVDTGAGYHTELTELGHYSRKSPSGDGDAHATLNNLRQAILWSVWSHTPLG